MKFNLPKINLSSHTIALASLAAIAFTSWAGLGLSMESKAEGEGLAPIQWVLLIQGSIAYAGFLDMLNDDVEKEKKPDNLVDESEDGRWSSVDDLQEQTHIVLVTGFDENFTSAAERTVQGVNAIDERLIRLARVNTTLLEEPRESKAKVEQTPFRAFRCCSRCKFIGEYRSSCAVVPFGCGTGDRSDDCREFEAKDDGNQGVETDRPEFEIVRVAMETWNSSSLWQE